MISRVGFKQFSHQSNRGFTLLEVLVSLTIMAMITTVAFTGLSVGIDSWHRGSRKIDELDHRFALERVFQRQVALIDHVVRGDRDGFEFSTSYSMANGSGDPVWVKYLFEGDKLLYSETPLSQFVPNQMGTPALTQTFDAVSMNRFQYLYSVRQDEYDWFTETMKDNPAAVRVDISGNLLTVPLVNKHDDH